MGAMAIYVHIVAGFLIAFFLAKNYVQRVFDLTGYNGFSPELLCLAVCAVVFAGIAAFFSGLNAAVLSALPPVALLAFLNRRAGKARYVLGLTFFQTVYGAFAPLFIAIWLAIKFMGIDVPNFSARIDKQDK